MTTAHVGPLTAAAPVAPLGGHSAVLLLTQLTVLVVSAHLLGRLAKRVGLPAVVGELGVGVLLGPSVFGQFVPRASDWVFPQQAGQFHLLDSVALLGVLVLVGVTGISLDFTLVRRRGGTVAWISLLGLVIPFGLGAVVAMKLLPGVLRPQHAQPTVFALFLGVALCVSAIPVIAKTLLDMGLIHRNVGQLILAAGTMDDIVGWLLLSVVSAMAADGLHTGTVLGPILHLAGLLLVLTVLGRPLVRGAMRWAQRSQSSAAVVVTAVAVLLMCATGTAALGLEPVFGAFLGGILIGTSSAVSLGSLAPLNNGLSATLAPVFFATAGLRMDMGALGQPAVLGGALLILGVAILGKFAGALLGGLTGRLNRWEILALGAGMNARGVVQLVVAAVGLRLGVLNTQSYTIIVLTAVITSVMAPPLLRLAMRRLEITAQEESRRRAMEPLLN
ncbi:sodium/hydrogen exchanger [Streptomyces violaceusniger Tu 4113]|uniref:Sodium/hydrogen exchanger n=1 Tax=Streptomyces violaceusniger (strain Tu 4113) TaxID=653045 RepID=G2PF94_STRV4|nr:sodium/hydrogen exchanger [Streptomyces violaceusniger Tu 4113]